MGANGCCSLSYACAANERAHLRDELTVDWRVLSLEIEQLELNDAVAHGSDAIEHP